jgi:hypothetical protein
LFGRQRYDFVSVSLAALDLSDHDQKMTLAVLAFENYRSWVSEIAQATSSQLVTIEDGYPTPGRGRDGSFRHFGLELTTQE